MWSGQRESPGGRPGNGFSIGADEDNVIEVARGPTSEEIDEPFTFTENELEQTPLIMPVIARPRSVEPPREIEVLEPQDNVLATVHEEDETSLEAAVPLKQHHLVMDVFNVGKEDGTWRQKSRFARYEEDCEGFDNHFGKPHVPFITMSAYSALQQVTPKSILLSDVEFKDAEDFCFTLETKVIDHEHPTLSKKLVKMVRARIASMEKLRPMNKVHSTSTQSLHGLQPKKETAGLKVGLPRSLISAPHNLSSLGVSPARRLPNSVSGLRFGGGFLREPDANAHPLEPVVWDETNEVSMLVTGVIPELPVCRLIAVRFQNTTAMPMLFPNIKNIRHVFFLVGPKLEDMEYVDMGRALASVASNPTYQETFDKIKSPESISRAIERYLAETVVIAPGRIDNKSLVAGDLIRKLVNMQADKHSHPHPAQAHVHPTDVDVERNAARIAKKKESCDGSWLFSGVRSDLRNRIPHYFSDFSEAWTPHIITVILYMVCVTVVPTLTFGAILSMGTNKILAVKECLIGQALTGFIWSFLSCQPLLVMSPTGPFLVFEKALYQFTTSYDEDFLEVRLYTGIFLFFMSIVGSACNIAGLIRFVTVFTEDIFCALISLIFFFEAYEFLEVQYHHNHIENLAYYVNNSINCTGIPLSECHLSRPNSFLMQFGMVVASIAIFHYLRQLSRSSFFGRTFRNLCGNFGGTFSVVAITVVYHLFFRNVDVSIVDIPEGLGDNHQHGYFVVPSDLPTGRTLAISAVAALLLFVLMFVETEIPQQMALRESRKLKKGGGLHWDLIVAGGCTLLCSFMGLPWQCPAAVQSLAHITALTVYKKTAPGEPNRPDRVIEQRVSGMATYAFLGVFAIFGHYVEIPSAAIFGVFFYLGIRNLNGNRWLERVKMWFLLAKYRGNHKFLDLAPFGVITFYTVIQTALLITMFTVKSTQVGGLFFPLMLVGCAFIVAKLLPCIFTKELLEALDGEDIDEEEMESDNDENPVDFYYNARIPV